MQLLRQLEGEEPLLCVRASGDWDEGVFGKLELVPNLRDPQLLDVPLKGGYGWKESGRPGGLHT